MYLVFIVRCILFASTISRFLHQHSLRFPFFVGCFAVSICSVPDFQPSKEKVRAELHVMSILFYSCSSVFEDHFDTASLLDFLGEILRQPFQLG